jgi:hypothetical protein
MGSVGQCPLYPQKADIVQHGGNVRFVPQADIYSLFNHVLARRLGLQFSPMSVQPMDFPCLSVVSDLPTSMTLIGKS